MYTEYVSDEHIILIHIDHTYTQGDIRTVAMVEDGKLVRGADYDHRLDCDVVTAFAACYGVHNDGNRKVA